MLTQSIASTSCGHSERGGSGRRSATSSASEQSPASAVRIAVSAIGSIAETAMPRRRQRAAENRHADEAQH